MVSLDRFFATLSAINADNSLFIVIKNPSVVNTVRWFSVASPLVSTKGIVWITKLQGMNLCITPRNPLGDCTYLRGTSLMSLV